MRIVLLRVGEIFTELSADLRWDLLNETRSRYAVRDASIIKSTSVTTFWHVPINVVFRWKMMKCKFTLRLRSNRFCAEGKSKKSSVVRHTRCIQKRSQPVEKGFLNDSVLDNICSRYVKASYKHTSLCMTNWCQICHKNAGKVDGRASDLCFHETSK